jgi:hypothetical protein
VYAQAAGSADAAKTTEGGLHVESYRTVGSYQVSVLHAESAAPAMKWLAEHDIRVPDSARKAMDAYATEGWCFLAAEFRKDSDRPLPPHPLKAVFDTDCPVYPMRLTGTQGHPVFLEMLVIGDKTAEVKGLRAWASSDMPIYVQVPREKRESRVFEEWQGESYAMAKGQIWTYLRAEVPSDAMTRDFEAEWRPYERFAVEVYDREQATRLFLLIATFGLPVLAFGVAFFPLFAGATRWTVGAAVPLALAGAWLCGYSWYSGVEKVETEEVRLGASPFG